MNDFKTMKWNGIVNIIVFILLGLLLLLFPEKSLNILGYLIASIFMLGGMGFIIKLIKNKGIETNGDVIYLINSIAAIALSITIFNDPTWIIRMINIVVGVILIICSIMNLINLLRFNKHKTTSWWIYFSLILLVIILGILVIINPLFLAKIIIRLEGAFLILNTLITLMISRRIKELVVVENKGELVVKN